MKKSIQVLVLLLIAAVTFSCGKSANEKNILGSWVSEYTGDEEGDEPIYIELTFFEDGRFEQLVNSSLRDNMMGIALKVTMALKTSGTWKVKGSILTVNYNGSTELLDYKLEYPNLDDEMRAALGDELGVVTEEEKAEVVEAFHGSMPVGDQRYPNLKVDEHTLSYTTIDGTENFTRKQ